MNLSRRRVLAAMTGAGGVGMLTARRTTAMFTDAEGFDGSLTTGTIDLVGTYEILDGPGAADPATAQGLLDGPRIEIPLGQLDETSPSGRMLLTFGLPEIAGAVTNPATLWLASDCPVPASTALAESIYLTLSYADCETGEPIEEIITGSVRAVADVLQTGIQIDGDPTTEAMACLHDEVCLVAEYELLGFVGEQSVDVPLWFAAVQCRNAEPTNPFAIRETVPCPPGDICTCCRTLGKLELEDGDQSGLGDSYVAPGTYAFTEGDTDYGLEIYDTTEKDGGSETTGVAFRLVRMDDPVAIVPLLCTVAIKGGPGFEEYERNDDTLSDTVGLAGADSNGIIYAPDGTAISHITVCICTTESEESCGGCEDPSLKDGGDIGADPTPPGGKP